jgi:hypothetical protein
LIGGKGKREWTFLGNIKVCVFLLYFGTKKFEFFLLHFGTEEVYLKNTHQDKSNNILNVNIYIYILVKKNTFKVDDVNSAK